MRSSSTTSPIGGEGDAMARLPRIGKAVSSLYERTLALEAMVEAGAVDPHECGVSLLHFGPY
jgi:hypothetical protein